MHRLTETPVPDSRVKSKTPFQLVNVHALGVRRASERDTYLVGPLDQIKLDGGNPIKKARERELIQCTSGVGGFFPPGVSHILPLT